MKQIPLLLNGALSKSGRSTCFLTKIVSVLTGQVYAFTSLDAAMLFNDGAGEIWYMPANAMQPMNMAWSSSLDPDNTEIHGWFDDVVKLAVDAGLLGNAKVQIYRVCYTKPELGFELVNFGIVTKIQLSASLTAPRKIEFKGYDHLLKTKQNAVFSLTCRNDFGDERCGMPFIWSSGSISQIDLPYLRFKVSGVAQADGFYNFGVVKFTDGDNTNVEMEVEEWGADGWVKLSFVTPYQIANLTGLDIRQDCGKTEADCLSYGNIINMNGEPMTPIQDRALMVPGAYIKSQGAA